MRKIVIFHFIFVFFSIIAQADVYVKGILHFEGSYRYGINVPGADVVNEWWFGKDKVTFISTGWRFKVDDVANNTDMRFTLDKKKQCIFVANLKEKFYIEIPLPMNLLFHMDKSIADSLKNFQINGDIKKTGKRETINQKVCDVYKVSEWISYGDSRFYDRDRTIMTTTDVPFNWKLANELFRLIRSFFNPQEKEDLKFGKKIGINGLFCAQCGRCRSQCPYNLDIPTVMRSYMYAYGYKNPALAKETLQFVDLHNTPCTDCHTCTVTCSMGFNIRNKILDIVRLKDVPEDFLV